MHIIRTEPLVTALAKQEVGGVDQARYLLTSFLVFIVPGYAGLMPTSGPGYSWAIAFEAWFYIAIAFFGVLAARDAAGGEKNRHFITEFTCLYVPVAVSTLTCVWATYWLIAWLCGEHLAAWSRSRVQFVQNLRAMGTDLLGFVTFSAHVVANSIIYLRLVKLLRRVRRLK